MEKIKFHLAAGTGAIIIETHEESRLLNEVLSLSRPTATVAAPSGKVVDQNTGNIIGTGLIAGYQWACAGDGRILIVYDWQELTHAPGHWRALIETLPALRQRESQSSLVIFVGPQFEFCPTNPIGTTIPKVEFAPPCRADIKEIARKLSASASPPVETGEQELNQIADALAGLSAQVIEQSIAECIATHGVWNYELLRKSRRRNLRDVGLEIWPPTQELGGLEGIKEFALLEILPFLGTDLAVRRLLCAGPPGSGKSYFARWLASQIGCEAALLSVPSLKAGIVGQSEGNLRRVLRSVDNLAAESPLILVLDEIDCAIQRTGLDSGVSSGMFQLLATWLQESKSQVIVMATLNHLENLDAALESRFAHRFYFELPSEDERKEIALIHLRRFKCEPAEETAEIIAKMCDGYSSREIAEHIIPSLARRTNRRPDMESTKQACRRVTPASRTQEEKIAAMRKAAQTLVSANTPTKETSKTARSIRAGKEVKNV